MFDFVQGYPEKPTGNLIVYAHTRGYNPIDERGDVIVCNVVVSFVAPESNQFPIVTFPPASLKKESELDKLLELNPSCDVFRLEDFEIPSDQNPESYLRKRIKEFNAVVIEYVVMCSDYIGWEKTKKLPKNLPSLRQILSQKNTQSNTQSGIRYQSRSAEEISYIDQLEHYLEVQKTVNAERLWPHFRKIISIIESKYPYYDVGNFARVIRIRDGEQPFAKSNLQLANLYLHKFRAIYEEKYEEAAKIQKNIQQLEQ